MRVIIAGGGMAGLTVAGLLARTGAHEVTVLEHASNFGDAGYGIGLYPLGGAVFNALGKADELMSRSVVLSKYIVYGPNGAELQSVDLSELLKAYGPMLGVSRSDLIDILSSCVPEGSLHFGVHAESAELSGGGVVVRAADGSSYSGDVAVAADGMNSALRKSFFGEVKRHDTGFDAWMWWAPVGTVAGDTAAEHWGPSSFVGLYPMRQGTNVAVGVPKALSPDPAGTPAAIVDALKAIVAEHNPGVAATPELWELGDSRPFLWPMQDVRSPQLTALDDRLAFVGDSGIGFLPTAGVGASNALRSAAALAYDLSLADAASVQLAVRRWRDRVRTLVEKNQEDSRQLAKVMMVKHQSASRVINAVMQHMPVTMMTKSIVKSMDVPF